MTGFLLSFRHETGLFVSWSPMRDVVAGQRPEVPWSEWAHQHGRLGGELAELFDWLETSSSPDASLDGCSCPGAGALTWSEVRLAVDAWVEGHLLWRARIDTVDAGTGAVTRSVLVHHLHRLVALAGHFGVTPASLACLVVVELPGSGSITALGEMARLARVLQTALPPTTVVAAMDDRRLAALVMLDESFRPALGELAAALAADPARPTLREVIPVPDRENLDALLVQL
jgi:hypothetical protein